MVKRAGLGVAWHAKPILASTATARIDHADLAALLYLQGYHAREILRG
jgi:phosphoserine phosphatase